MHHAILLPARLGGRIVASKGFKLPGVHQIAQLLADRKKISSSEIMVPHKGDVKKMLPIVPKKAGKNKPLI